ncbi:Transglycosylase [Lachnospiraceae bacterium NLAE-zl-G231]|nr:Transglycosylase [Lachnospiraceae bacterium NLAE-zl-G231]
MRFIKKFIITLFVILLLGAGAAGGRLLWQGYQIYQEVIDGEPLSDKVEEIRSKPKYTPLSQLPDTYKNAVVAVEDKRFYKHGGIDLISTGRAVFINLKEKKLAEGGSSITQQLAKNMYFSQEKTFLRKVAELFVAFELEKNYTKDEILELYVNTIYFGSGYYCVYDAAQGYFEKEPEQMNDYESTLLAGIPNAPSVYALTNRPELAVQRQRTVVECMVEQKYLTREEADRILQEGEQIQQAGQNNE